MDEASGGLGSLSLRWRLALAVGAVLLAWAVLATLGRSDHVDLVLVLLPMLVLAFAIGAVCGAVAGVAASLALVLLVNWYVVPPVHTLSIAGTESQVALAVFVLAAVAASLLTERVIRARAQAAASLAERRLIAGVVEEPSAAEALQRFRSALGLDLSCLLRADVAVDGEPLVCSPAGERARQGRPLIDVQVLDEYRLVGYGPERIAVDPAFVESLAVAVARAYESGLLQEEQARSDRLADLDRSRSALLASVGHDLRTPLSSIRLASEALLDDDDARLAPVDRHELLATIRASSRRLDELITNLLDLSRIESGAVISRPQDCAVDGLIDEAVAEVDSPLVSVECAEGLTAHCDPALVDRVLVNLLSNAVRHQGGALPIEVRAAACPGGIAIDVVDHGVGIDPDQLTSARRPFAQVGTRADGGTGTGLSIAHEFCAAMGGSLDLRPTTGGGLTATVVLPEASA